jgi:RNA polymerase sigma-70 factor (sigma-E family)
LRRAAADGLGMRKSDEPAFVEFVTVRSGPLLRFACLLTGDVGEAEDLLQAALVKLAGRWSAEIRDPNAYVKRSLVNLANRRWRSRQRREQTERLGWVVNVPDPAETHAETDVLIRALRDLPQRQRLMVVLRYVEGMSEREAAQFASCSVGTVKSHASRGLARLRAALSEPPIVSSRKAKP